MWTLAVVVRGVDAQHRLEVAAAEDQQPVETLGRCGRSARRRRSAAGGGRGPDDHRRHPHAVYRQEFNFAGPWGDNSFLEDYTAQVRGEPIGCIALVTRNAAGQTQHIAANYRPRSSLLLLSRLLGEKFAGTPQRRRRRQAGARRDGLARREPLFGG
jgi:hypothetical protein